MRIAFRVDASTSIGTGHLMRCHTLARALRARGAEILFICREHDGHMGDFLVKEGFSVSLLPVSPIIQNQEVKRSNYASWLGTTQAIDAVQTIEVLQDSGQRLLDWLIIDHYGLGDEWEKNLRGYSKKIMVIDDLADRFHDCDLLLNQNYVGLEDVRYQFLVPTTCQSLLGPGYALIRSEYIEHCKTLESRTNKKKRVLLFMGGADSANMTGLALRALSFPELSHLEVDVVVGVNNVHIKIISAQIAMRSKTNLHTSLPHLADLMVQADLAIGAGGSTTWERMCLGLPAIVISIADNQESICRALAKESLIEYLGNASNVTIEELTKCIKKTINNDSWMSLVSLNSQSVVDGFGTSRVIEAIVNC